LIIHLSLKISKLSLVNVACSWKNPTTESRRWRLRDVIMSLKSSDRATHEKVPLSCEIVRLMLSSLITVSVPRNEILTRLLVMTTDASKDVEEARE